MRIGQLGYTASVTPTAADLSAEPATEVLSVTRLKSTRVVGGRYELGPIIGRGGMSTVFDALDQRTGGRVAVKVFRPGVELADSPARRMREVQLASAVRHSGVVAVLDAQLDDHDRFEGCAFLVTELVEGATLGDRLRVSPLSEREVVGLGLALCDTLAAIHEVGIVHRDIKPANVLLPGGKDGLLHPKLADFGIALMVDSTRMTATGFMAGTANYVSPEQVQGQTITPASDVYSLGLVLIETVRGVPVFGGSGIEAAVARLNADPVPPDHLDPDLSWLLASMTDRTPSNRPSARSAADQFHRLRGGGLASDIFAIDATPPAIRTRRWQSGHPGKHRGMGALVAGLIAIAALTTGLAVSAGVTRQSQAPATTPSVAAAASNPAPRSSAPTNAVIGSGPVSDPLNNPAPPPADAAITQPSATAVSTAPRATNSAGKAKNNNRNGNGQGKGD